MKKLIISGSSKLYERALYWRGYFEGRGYEVIDWPSPVTDDPNSGESAPTPGFLLGRLLKPSDDSYATQLVKLYQRFWRNLDQADVFFLMNEDRDGVEGYIGSSAIAELTYAVIGNLNRGRKTEIYILKMPDKSQNCYTEVKFWLDQGWLKIYQPPTGRKALTPIAGTKSQEPAAATEPESTEPTPVEPVAPAESAPAEAEVVESAPTRRHGLFGHADDRTVNLMSCKKKALARLSIREREYLNVFCQDVPAWLLRYIAAPEMQRLADVSMTSMDYSALYSFTDFNSVFCHSIGVALIIWNFTHDKKQTLAGLFHDIASPSFKHCIDVMNGDAETQESIESRTGEIIRSSRVIMRQLKKDGILASEVADYHLYPIADNDIPGLAADRLEYTFSNGYFLYETWSLDDVRRLYSDITVLTNEEGLDELGFSSADLAAEFTGRNLPLAAMYHCDKARASLQFIADMIKSMIVAGHLTTDDLYIMTEREIIDWILSCGDRTLAEAFRGFQRATSVYSGNTTRRNLYTINMKAKIRYIVPLVATDELDENDQPISRRITEIDREIESLVDDYLAEKPAKYVGFDFEFKPYAEAE